MRFQSTRRGFIRVAAAGGAGLALAACATPAATQPAPAQVRPKHGGTLTLANGFDMAELDPATSSGAVNSFFHQQIIDRLLTAGRDLKLQPGLAERWETAADLKSVTLFLRKGVTYHDGTPFDAASVKWNLERNKTHPRTVHARALADVTAVDVLDPSTVRISLKGPFATFTAQLTTPLAAMLSRTEVERLGENFGKGPHKAGSGPFIIQEAVANDRITLVRNPNWWGRDQFGGQLPYVDRLVVRVVPDSTVRFTNVRTGAMDCLFDVAAEDLTLASTESSMAVNSVPGVSWWELHMNHKPGNVFNEPRYAKAVNMAIDRAELVRVAYQNTGVPGYGPICPSHFPFDPNFKPFEKPDIAGARALVAQVGKGPMSFEILYQGGDTGILQAAQLLQAQLKRADIDVKLRGMLRAQWIVEHTAGTFPGVSFADSGTGNIDPDVRFYDHTHSKGRSNYGKYANAEVDRLLDEQRTTADQAKRTELLRRAQQIAYADAPRSAVLLFNNNYAVYQKAVKGWEAHPVTRPTFETAWLDR